MNINNKFEDNNEALQEEAEVKFDFKIEIKKEVEDKINWLTKNYSDEIAAFLTGEIKDNTLLIDGLLFYHQDVSSGSVEVEPKNLVKLRKEYGNECIRIIGHWHSHNTMGAFWSHTDHTFINQYSKTKEICLFLVSSANSKHRIMLTLNKPFQIRLDNLNYEVPFEDVKLETDLRKVIAEKVTKRPLVQNNWSYGGEGINGWQDSDTQVNGDLNSWEDPPKNFNELEQKETIQERVREAICYNHKERLVIVKTLSTMEAEILAEETKAHNPQMKRNGVEYDILYHVESKRKAITLIKELREHLTESFEAFSEGEKTMEGGNY